MLRVVSDVSSTTQDPATSAAELMRHEAQALMAAAGRIDSGRFSEAVRILVECGGAVATTGAGTSGIVARKIAATLTSTGTPAIFVHPTDALHGGLGVIGRKEVVVAVSNSGETEELIALVPYLRNREVNVIAIVGALDSSLAKQATVALEAFAEHEAGALGIVPTASVAVALAVGDALALAAMEVKGFTRETFAANHPAGRLGRRLTLRVSDVAHSGESNPTVGPDAQLLDALRAITEGGLGAVSIVDANGSLLGIITDGDVRRALERHGPSTFVDLRTDEIMTRDPVVVGPETMAYEALRLMEDRPSQIAVLPVVEDDRSIGLVRLHDLIRIGL